MLALTKLRRATTLAAVLAAVLAALALPAGALADAPATTGAATGVSATSATLNGTIETNGQPGSYRFDYGTSISYSDHTTIRQFPASPSTIQVQETVQGLQPQTTYHFRLAMLQGTYPNQVANTGLDVTFTTPAAAGSTGTPGVATTAPASNITATGATLNAIVNPQGIDSVYEFVYGTDLTYGKRTTPQSISANGPVPVSANITGLNPNVTYHFRVLVLQGSYPAQTASSGADTSFTTLGPYSQPKPKPKPKPKPRPKKRRKPSKYGTAVLTTHSVTFKGLGYAVPFRCKGRPGSVCKGTISLSVTAAFNTPTGRHTRTVSCGTGKLAASAPRTRRVRVALPPPYLCGLLIGVSPGRRHSVNLVARFTTHQKPLRARITLIY